MLIASESSRTESLLSAAEERALARAMEAGVLAQEALATGGRADATTVELQVLVRAGEAARQRFVSANVRLVRMVAGQFSRRTGLSFGDLVQEGMVGLMTAVQRYDIERGLRFSTYGMFWVRAMVSAATARMLGGHQLSTSRAAQLRQVREIEMALVQRLGRLPTVAEVAEVVGRPVEWTETLVRYESPCGIDDVDPVAFAESDTVDQLFERQRPGAELLDGLSRTSRQVLELRFGFADGRVWTVPEIGLRLGLNTARVRRIELAALDELRSVCPQSAVEYLRSA